MVEDCQLFEPTTVQVIMVAVFRNRVHLIARHLNIRIILMADREFTALFQWTSHVAPARARSPVTQCKPLSKTAAIAAGPTGIFAIRAALKNAAVILLNVL